MVEGAALGQEKRPIPCSMSGHPKRSFSSDRTVSASNVSRPRLSRDASFLEANWKEIAKRRDGHNRLGFAYQVAFVRVLGRFTRQAPLEIDEEVLRCAALQLGADPETIHAYARRQQTVSEHHKRIGQYLRLRVLDADAGDRLARFLEGEALRLDRTASLLARAPGFATSAFSCRLTLCCAAPSGLLGEKTARSWQSEWRNASPR